MGGLEKNQRERSGIIYALHDAIGGGDTINLILARRYSRDHNVLFGKVQKCKVRALETLPIYWNMVGAVREWKGILPHVVLMIIMSGNCETMIILIIKFIQPMSAPTPPTLPLLPTQLSPGPYFQVFENPPLFV